MPASVSAKPKVFRLPPAAHPELPPVPRKRNVTRWLRNSLWLLAFVFIWQGVQKGTGFYLKHVAGNNGNAHSEAFDGMLEPAVGDAQATPLPQLPPTILLRGKGDAIIGQMAKIPALNEPIIEVKAASALDKNAGHELLAIISKY